jgi:hypothetical protein
MCTIAARLDHHAGADDARTLRDSRSAVAAPTAMSRVLRILRANKVISNFYHRTRSRSNSKHKLELEGARSRAAVAGSCPPLALLLLLFPHLSALLRYVYETGSFVTAPSTSTTTVSSRARMAIDHGEETTTLADGVQQSIELDSAEQIDVDRLFSPPHSPDSHSSISLVRVCRCRIRWLIDM